jgi:GT2 family glycosyltransferase
MISRRRDRQRTTEGVDAADGARRRSDWETAVAGYRTYLHRRPGDFGVRVRLIKTLYAAARFEEAGRLLDETALARPDKPELAELALNLRAARGRAVPIADYDLFRRGVVIPPPPPPPSSLAAAAVAVLIDARGASSQRIDRTLASLQRSEIPTGSVGVWSDDQEPSLAPANPVLMLGAGVELDPHGLGWLLNAIRTTGAVAAYGDDDRAVGEGEATVWSDPAFHAAPHPLDLATTPRLPAAILFQSGAALGLSGPADRRGLLVEALASGPVAHVPLLLATVRADAVSPTPAVRPGAVSAGGSDARISAIIPTRDEGKALAAMIESLETRAARRTRLEIVVVDNGSRDPDTLALLDALTREGRIRVLTVDEPFNWSRLNNLAAESIDAEVLLFANNDMQMLTGGWDDRLRQSLFQPGVGVVGARLLYPDGLLQHAGMVLGGLDGKPVHEGLGANRTDGGPLDRWRRTRPAAAVTGAFMGVRRDVFEQAGGFNPVEFAVGCNDIDFCLRARERGWSVLYAADLELIHMESHSRGHDDTEARMARARGEMEALFRIWGSDTGRDPGRNPHWVNHETLLYHGVRQPDVDQVEAWIRRSVDLWRVAERDA